MLFNPTCNTITWKNYLKQKKLEFIQLPNSNLTEKTGFVNPIDPASHTRNQPYHYGPLITGLKQ
jgi:hypothetical protein